jgi:hypothetical protein
MGNIMKNFFLLLALSTTLLFAQETSKWSLYGGVTSMNTSIDESATNLLGSSLGFGYKITDKLSIGMGLSQRGFTGEHGYDEPYCYWDEEDDRICFDIEDDTDKDEGRENDRPLFDDGEDEWHGEHEISTRYEGVELWMSYTLFDNDNFSLWTGPVYSVLYELTEEIQADDFTESFTEEIEESDYGLMIGATLPIKNKLGMNIGYYHSLDEMEFNNVFIELNLFL